MKKLLIILAAILAVLVFAFCLIRIHNGNIRQRGREDGYREGYLTGQAHRANGQEYNSNTELQHAFPRNYLEQKRTPGEQLHYKAFHMAWPSGYYDGWHGILPWSEVDMEADRWSP